MNRTVTRLTIEGQGLVEYALIIMLVAIAITGALLGLRAGITDSLMSSTSALP